MNRYIVYAEGGHEICDCDSRYDALAEMERRADRFPGVYTLTENEFYEENDCGFLREIASEKFDRTAHND